MLVVTGGAGFIGSAIVWALNERGRKDILIVDTLGSDGKWKNLRGKQFEAILSPDDFFDALDELTSDIEAILHIGAVTDTSDPDAGKMYERNTACTRALAAHALENDIRFVYASSASVYGDGSLGFSDDDALTPKLLPMNPYAFSKWLSDMEAIREGWTEKIAGLRFFNVFGPNEYHKGFMASVVWHLASQARATGQMKLFQSHKSGYADGEQRRDFVYVKDLCDVVLWFLDHSEANGIFNLGTGQARTYNDVASAIFLALDKPRAVSYIPTPESIRDAYQYFTEADLTKLRAAGYDRPFTSLEDAVGDYVKTYLENSANPYL
jgi:ADP-L-glycero-D-manno-heptose 6-epimerase